MKSFDYTIRDPLGIHARPAGLLVKTVKSLNSQVTLRKGDKSTAADRLLSVMGLGIRSGETVTVTLEGGDEEKNSSLLREFFETNL